MTEPNDARLRDALTSWLRRRGELSGAETVSGEAITRWLDGAGSNPDMLAAQWWEHTERDLESWWESASTDLHWFVLHGLRERAQDDRTTTSHPAWWPAYELWLEPRVRPWIRQSLEGVLHERTEGLHKQESEIREAESWVMYFTNTDRAGAREYLLGKALRIPAVTVSGPMYGMGAPAFEIRVASPLVGSSLVADAYEQLASTFRGAFSEPAVEPESVDFFLAYDELQRSGIRGKADRLAALPEELRGTRNPGSASAFHGKLKKRFNDAFEVSEGWLQIPEDVQESMLAGLPALLEQLPTLADDMADYEAEVGRLHQTIYDRWKGGDNT